MGKSYILHTDQNLEMSTVQNRFRVSDRTGSGNQCGLSLKRDPNQQYGRFSMNKIQAGRLLTLAYFLKTEVPPELFDMYSYCSRRLSGLGFPKEHLGECGTTACALGWATVVFPQKFRFGPTGGIVPIGPDNPSNTPIRYSYEPYQKFFGISAEEAEQLFASCHNRSPLEEAAVIEELVFEKGWWYDE